MTDLHMPTLRQARPEDWYPVRALLENSALPVEDLGPDRLDGFLIAEYDGALVGLIGLDVYDTTGLLRSLVVAKDVRSTGIGGKLVGALESAAETAGITELWLLTTDAAPFFERHGFEIVQRDIAPGHIRQTDEFSTLCPDSADLMRKTMQ